MSQQPESQGPEQLKAADGKAPPEKEENKQPDLEGEDQPAGGYDDTPLPKAPPGWTVKITFHKATNLPMADINTFSSDPYVLAQINTDLRSRHAEDPALRLRTPTIRRDTDPEWNCEWIVANVPSSGFKMKARVYDEDPADHDDRLGNAHISVSHISDNWEGIHNQPFKIMKRSGSKRAYAMRAVAVAFNRAKHLNGDLYVSVEVLGRTEGENGSRCYTVGPCWYTQHYSPLLGRIANRKDSSSSEEGASQSKEEKKKAERYNFQANQMQLQGPVPEQLYHRFVEFRPFVKNMFTSHGIQGWFLYKALHHQHARVYNFDSSTVWGHFPEGPSKKMTNQFLELVHHDQGGRIFTYVLTLDALFRFTETGKEFGIDMLSKHTMHSDVSGYIAFSGEFFVRRLKNPNRPPPPEPAEETSQSHLDGVNGEVDRQQTHPPDDIEGGPPRDDPPKDPAYFELIIDNDSGTYRPNAKLLPQLRDFLAHSLPGLHIQVLDCQADQEKMSKWKQQQRDRKKEEGQDVVYTQGSIHSRKSSISSSDEEELDHVEAENGEHHDHSASSTVFKDAGKRSKAHVLRFKGRKSSVDAAEGQDVGAGSGAVDDRH